MNSLILVPLLSVAMLAVEGQPPETAETPSQERLVSPPELGVEDALVEAESASVDLEAAPVVVEATPAPAPASDAPMLFADLSDDEVFTRAADAVEAIGTLRARFQQFAPSGAQSAGTVSLSRPGRMRFDYDEPNPQLIVASNGLVYVHDADLETTDSYPVGKTPLQFLLSKKLDREAARVEGVYRSEDGVAVVLAANDEDLQGELALIFSGTEMALTDWAVFEPSGRVTRVALSDIELDVRLSGQLFKAPKAGGIFLRDR